MEAGVEARTEEPEAAEDPAVPRFRILKRGDWQRALRLEEIFWSILEAAAKANALKLTDYVRGILDGKDGTRNQSSELRVAAATWLKERLEDRERRLRQAGPAQFLKGVPVPGFIISGSRGLVAYNAEFVNFVRQSADKHDVPRVSEARLTLDLQIDQIIETLREGTRSTLDRRFELALNAQRLRGRVRVSLVPGSEGYDVMGFVTAVERKRGD